MIFTIALLMIAGYGFGRIITDIGFAIGRYRARRLAIKRAEEMSDALRRVLVGELPGADMPAFTERVVARGRN